AAAEASPLPAQRRRVERAVGGGEPLLRRLEELGGAVAVTAARRDEPADEGREAPHPRRRAAPPGGPLLLVDAPIVEPGGGGGQRPREELVRPLGDEPAAQHLRRLQRRPARAQPRERALGVAAVEEDLAARDELLEVLEVEPRRGPAADGA